ncbi:hypothetical protein Ancab_008681 [Ancistrocladus abbreviatus]
MSKKPVGLPIVQSMDKILLLNRLQAAAEEGDHAKDEKNSMVEDVLRSTTTMKGQRRGLELFPENRDPMAGLKLQFLPSEEESASSEVTEGLWATGNVDGFDLSLVVGAKS